MASISFSRRKKSSGFHFGWFDQRKGVAEEEMKEEVTLKMGKIV
jgi:hypothetical protein